MSNFSVGSSNVSKNDLIRYHKCIDTIYESGGLAVVRHIDHMFDSIIVDPIDNSQSIEL